MEEENLQLQKQLHVESRRLKTVEAKQKKEQREIVDATRENEKLRASSSLLSTQVAGPSNVGGEKEYFHHKEAADAKPKPEHAEAAAADDDTDDDGDDE